MKVPQSRDELVEHLREQVRFLEASCRSYDAGFEGEAKRLAVVLRVLCHDTQNSRSLLGLLGAKAALQYHDVIGVTPEDDPCVGAFFGLRFGFTPKGVRYFPKLDPPKRRIDFDSWWHATVLLDKSAGLRFTRRDAVLSLANTDGGAHVDPRLDAAYVEITRDKSLGGKIQLKQGQGAVAGVFENSPALPIARQTAHELAGTIHEQLSELVPGVAYKPKEPAKGSFGSVQMSAVGRAPSQAPRPFFPTREFFAPPPGATFVEDCMPPPVIDIDGDARAADGTLLVAVPLH